MPMSRFMVVLLIVVFKQRLGELAASTNGQTENGDTRTWPQLMDANPLFLKKSLACRDFSCEGNYARPVPVLKMKQCCFQLPWLGSRDGDLCVGRSPDLEGLRASDGSGGGLEMGEGLLEGKEGAGELAFVGSCTHHRGKDDDVHAEGADGIGLGGVAAVDDKGAGEIGVEFGDGGGRGPGT